MRHGTISDWYEFLGVMRALDLGHISFSRFAELGREWLAGADAVALQGKLPMTQCERIMHCLRTSAAPRTARDLDTQLGFPCGRTAELCGRLRKRGLVRTERRGGRITVYLARPTAEPQGTPPVRASTPCATLEAGR